LYAIGSTHSKKSPALVYFDVSGLFDAMARLGGTQKAP
jgi:hypothetical protein